jgi:GntR family transcriptional regulator/MocR family aminotransferase
MDQHSSAIDQATLARFINEGFFLSHIKRMRRLYAERREFFLNEFNKLLGDRFTLQIPEAGLNFVAWLRCETDFAKVARVCTDIGIKPSPLSSAFVFGFAGWTPAQIRQSLLRLASALR